MKGDEQYANEKGYKLILFPADWSLGRKAGPLRNEQMVRYADAFIALWYNKSSDTKNMIDLAWRYGLNKDESIYVLTGSLLYFRYPRLKQLLANTNYLKIIF